MLTTEQKLNRLNLIKKRWKALNQKWAKVVEEDCSFDDSGDYIEEETEEMPTVETLMAVLGEAQ